MEWQLLGYWQLVACSWSPGDKTLVEIQVSNQLPWLLAQQRLGIRLWKFPAIRESVCKTNVHPMVIRFHVSWAQSGPGWYLEQSYSGRDQLKNFPRSFLHFWDSKLAGKRHNHCFRHKLILWLGLQIFPGQVIGKLWKKMHDYIFALILAKPFENWLKTKFITYISQIIWAAFGK